MDAEDQKSGPSEGEIEMGGKGKWNRNRKRTALDGKGYKEILRTTRWTIWQENETNRSKEFTRLDIEWHRNSIK